MAALIEECGTEKHYPLAMFRNGIPKKTRSSYKGAIDDGTPLSSSDSEMESTVKKNRRSTLEKIIKMYCYYLKAEDDALFKNR